MGTKDELHSIDAKI
jgi:predicted  nucleic acid-binding Zn-ribbon protein